MSTEGWIEPRPNKAKRIFLDFPEIPTSRFGKENFRMLVKVLSQVYSEWEGIGLCLEITQSRMSNLGDKWKRQSNRGLISILDEWMKGHYAERKLYPCWKSVVYIVADAMGGRNPAAARIIAKNWEAYEADPFFGCDVAKSADSSPLYALDDKKNRFIKLLYADYLHEVGQLWYEIGVLLGVPFNILETIDTKHDKLKEVIDAWIDLYDDPVIDYLPTPTIQVLVDAVSHVMGGNNQALATGIAENVKVPCDVEQQHAHSGSTTASTTRTQPQSQPQPQAQQQPETPVTEVTSSEVQTYSTYMTVDQLYSWLLSNNMPQEDCEIFREKKINGEAFSYCSEEEWKSFGISFGGLMILKKRIMNQVSSSANPGHLNGSSSNGSANGSTNGSSNGTVAASPQGNSKTSGHTLVKDHHYGSLCEQLRPCAASWEDIAKALGFKGHEIAYIRAEPMKLTSAPGSYMDGTIEKWSHWAPGDARGSKDYATLEALRTAVDKAGISDIALTLTLK